MADVRERGTTFESDLAVKDGAVDLAIGANVDTGLGAIVSSNVDDVVMRPVGPVIGGVDFSNLFDVVSNRADAAAQSLAAAWDAGVAAPKWGVSINARP